MLRASKFRMWKLEIQICMNRKNDANQSALMDKLVVELVAKHMSREVTHKYVNTILNTCQYVTKQFIRIRKRYKTKKIVLISA